MSALERWERKRYRRDKDGVKGLREMKTDGKRDVVERERKAPRYRGEAAVATDTLTEASDRDFSERDDRRVEQRDSREKNTVKI